MKTSVKVVLLVAVFAIGLLSGTTIDSLTSVSAQVSSPFAPGDYNLTWPEGTDTPVTILRSSGKWIYVKPRSGPSSKEYWVNTDVLRRIIPGL